MKKKISKSLLMTTLITGLCIGGAQGVFAAEDLNTFALDEYVVTATRTMKQLQEVPASVSVVTAKEIEEKNIMSVPEAVATLPGVYKSQAAQGGITLRGFGSSDILVMVDGMYINSARNNEVAWEMVPIDNVERIEVVRGAGSSLYGGRAVAGVINIITKDNRKEKGAKVNANLNYGSNNTWKKALAVDVRANEKISFGVGYENRKSDGFPVGKPYVLTPSELKSTESIDAVPDNVIPQDKDGNYIVGYRGNKVWENESITANLKYDFDEDRYLKYYFAHTESSSRYGRPITNVFVNGKEFFKGNLDVGLNNKALKMSTGSALLGTDTDKETNLHTLTYNDEKNKFTVNMGYHDIKRDGYTTPDAGNIDRYYDGPGNDSVYPNEMYTMDFQKAWENIGKHTIVFGGNIRQENYTQDKVYLKNWRDYNSIDTSKYNNGVASTYGGKARNIALFVQDEYKVSDPLTMYLGLRFDHFKKYDGFSKFYDKNTGTYTGGDKYDSVSYNELSPKIAFDFKADDSTNYFASYGHSFNPPGLYMLYRSTTYTGDYGTSSAPTFANPNLDPETSDTFEIGMKKKVNDKTDLGITLYYVKTDDKITSVQYSKTEEYPKGYKLNENVDEGKHYGIELEVTHKFDENWDAYFNYAWQQAKNTDGKTSVEETDYNVPKHLLHAGVSYTKDKFNGILECQYVSERQAPDAVTGEYESQDAFFIVNTALNYKLSKGMTLQFGIDNIFDKEFYCSEATSGRTYYTGLRYSF